MNILGLNFHGHDAAAALLKDGDLAACSEEERYHRFKKHYGGFPEQSIAFCLERAGLDARELDHVGYYISKDALFSREGLSYALRPLLGARNKLMLASRLLYYYHCLTLRGRLERHFPTLNPKARVHFVAHHDAHMASSFFISPFEEADIISLDGVGEWETTVLGRGKGNAITRLSSTYFPHSIGYFFSAVTRHLGFRVNNDEYKVMGLAGYGDPSRFRALMRRVVRLEEGGGFSIDPRYLRIGLGWGQVSGRFTEECGVAPRAPESELLQEHKDLAAAVQELTEELGVHLARGLQKRTGGKNICLSGGVALNCIMNARILEETDYQDIFIQPAAYDASGSLGSALWIEHMVLGRPRRWEMRHAYHGYEAADGEVLAALRNFPEVTFRKCDDIAKDAAAEIAKQRIVGWYQGRMEWGPRALGNRSLLADPRERRMMDYVNDKVKHREDFRPFAPSVKLESYKDYFDFPVPSPFMLLICKVKEAMRSKIAAVTHTDGTARYHTVDKAVNPLYWRLIDEFEKLSGVPVLLNTSFNVRGETIVRTPEDAVRCFLGTGIDVLAIGDYLVEKAHA